MRRTVKADRKMAKRPAFTVYCCGRPDVSSTVKADFLVGMTMTSFALFLAGGTFSLTTTEAGKEPASCPSRHNRRSFIQPVNKPGAIKYLDKRHVDKLLRPGRPRFGIIRA